MCIFVQTVKLHSWLVVLENLTWSSESPWKTGCNFFVWTLSLSAAPSALDFKLQPADKMLRHADEKPTFRISNRCYVTLLRMTAAQVVETSVTVNNNSPIQDCVHPYNPTQPTYEMTPGLKPFTVTHLCTHLPPPLHSQLFLHFERGLVLLATLIIKGRSLRITSSVQRKSCLIARG